MQAVSGTPLLDRATVDDARTELSKFFIIATIADQSPGMFSKFIDAEWHRLAETADYSDFCRQSAGRPVAHAPINGEGEVTWIGMYHEQFGALPSAWFADETGAVDAEAYGEYLDTYTVRASWNCTPVVDPD